MAPEWSKTRCGDVATTIASDANISSKKGLLNSRWAGHHATDVSQRKTSQPTSSGFVPFNHLQTAAFGDTQIQTSNNMISTEHRNSQSVPPQLLEGGEIKDLAETRKPVVRQSALSNSRWAPKKTRGTGDSLYTQPTGPEHIRCSQSEYGKGQAINQPTFTDNSKAAVPANSGSIDISLQQTLIAGRHGGSMTDSQQGPHRVVNSESKTSGAAKQDEWELSIHPWQGPNEIPSRRATYSAMSPSWRNNVDFTATQSLANSRTVERPTTQNASVSAKSPGSVPMTQDPRNQLGHDHSCYNTSLLQARIPISSVDHLNSHTRKLDLVSHQQVAIDKTDTSESMLNTNSWKSKGWDKYATDWNQNYNTTSSNNHLAPDTLTPITDHISASADSAKHIANHLEKPHRLLRSHELSAKVNSDENKNEALCADVPLPPDSAAPLTQNHLTITDTSPAPNAIPASQPSGLIPHSNNSDFPHILPLMAHVEPQNGWESYTQWWNQRSNTKKSSDRKDMDHDSCSHPESILATPAFNADAHGIKTHPALIQNATSHANQAFGQSQKSWKEYSETWPHLGNCTESGPPVSHHTFAPDISPGHFSSGNISSRSRDYPKIQDEKEGEVSRKAVAEGLQVTCVDQQASTPVNITQVPHMIANKTGLTDGHPVKTSGASQAQDLDPWAKYTSDWNQSQTIASSSLRAKKLVTETPALCEGMDDAANLNSSQIPGPELCNQVKPDTNETRHIEHESLKGRQDSKPSVSKFNATFDATKYGHPRHSVPSKAKISPAVTTHATRGSFLQKAPLGHGFGSKFDPSLLNVDAFNDHIDINRIKIPNGTYYSRTVASPSPKEDDMFGVREGFQVWTDNPKAQDNPVTDNSTKGKSSSNELHELNAKYLEGMSNFATNCLKHDAKKKEINTEQACDDHRSITRPCRNLNEDSNIPTVFIQAQINHSLTEARSSVINGYETTPPRIGINEDNEHTHENINPTTKDEQRYLAQLVIAEARIANNIAPSDAQLTTERLTRAGKAPESRSDTTSFDQKISDAGVTVKDIRNILGSEGAEQLRDFDGKFLPAPVDWEERQSFENSHVPQYINSWSECIPPASSIIDISIPEFRLGTHITSGEKLVPPPAHHRTILAPSDQHDEVHVAVTSSEAIKTAKLTQNAKVEDERALVVAETRRRLDVATMESERDPFSPSVKMYLRPATKKDAAEIATLYNYYILNSIIPEDQLEVTPRDISSCIEQCWKYDLPFIVAVKGTIPPVTDAQGRGTSDNRILPQFEGVIGFAFAEIFRFGIKGLCTGRSRCNALLQLYVHHEYQQKGVGRNLFDRLLHTMSHSYGYRNAAKWIDPEEKAININCRRQKDRWHQLFIQLPIHSKDEEKYLRIKSFLAKFYFTEKQVLDSAVRTSTTHSTVKFSDLVIFQGTALPENTFGPCA